VCACVGACVCVCVFVCVCVCVSERDRFMVNSFMVSLHEVMF
jgi:hypothetical protein